MSAIVLGVVDRWVLGDGVIDLAQREFRRDGATLALTPLEVGLLRYLAANPHRVVPREELQLAVWGHRAVVATRAVDNTVSRLRRKIEREPERPRHLRSHRGGGYSLEAVVAERAAPAVAGGLFGRRDALDRLRDALEAHGAVCLTGPGGVGKSRLAAEHAARVGGAITVALAGAGPDRTAHAIGAAIGIDLPTDADAALVRLLSARGALPLVLEGAEPHAASVGRFVAALVAAAPTVRVIVPCRVRVPGLTELPVEPLPASEAVALFRARAPGLEDGPDLRSLVARLEGIPLAIELAAARAWMFPPAELARRVGERFALLGQARVGGLTLPALRTVIAWSLELLEPPAREGLARLAVFRGGFTAAAAEAVLGPDLPAAELLETLRDQSLLRVVPGPSPRMALFDAVRELALEALGPRPDAEDRLADWLVSGTSGGPDGDHRYPASIAAEAENLRAACALGARGDPARFARLVFHRALRCRAIWTDVPYALELLDRAIEAGPPAPQLARLLAQRASRVHYTRARPSAEADALEALRVARACGDPAALTSASNVVALIRFSAGRVDEALELVLAALDRAEHPAERVKLLESATEYLIAAGRLPEALARLEEAYRVARRAGDPTLIATTAIEIGSQALADGAWETAERRLDEALAAQPEEVIHRSRALVLRALVGLLRGGDPEEARARTWEAHALVTRAGLPIPATYCDAALAQADWAAGKPRDAAAVLGEAARRFDALGRRDYASAAYAWQAMALADAGDPDASRAALGEARSRRPGDAPAADLGAAEAWLELRCGGPDEGRAQALSDRLRELRPELPTSMLWAVHRVVVGTAGPRDPRG